MNYPPLDVFSALASRGAKLVHIYCNDHPTTSYFILNRDIMTSLRSAKALGTYRHLYRAGGYEQGYLAQITRNPKVVRRMVVLTTALLSGISRLCHQVDETIVLTPEDIDALEAFAQLSPNSHKNLFPGEPINPEIYAFTPYLGNKRIYPDEPPNYQAMLGMYGVSSYGKLLNLPQEELKNYVSTFSPKEFSYEKATLWLKEQGISNTYSALILSPYAPDAEIVSSGSYEEILAFCKENDLSVFTQTFTKEQSALPGTIEISLPLDVLYALSLKGVSLLCGSNFLLNFAQSAKMDVPLLAMESDKRLEGFYPSVRFFSARNANTLGEEFSAYIFEKKQRISGETAYEQTRFQASMAQVAEGALLAERHCPPEEETVYFVANRHIGDVFLFLKSVKTVKVFYGKNSTYREKYGHTRVISTVKVITTRVLAGVAELYADVDSITILSAKEVQALKMFAYSCTPEEPHIIGDAMLWVDVLVEEIFYGVNELLHHLPIPAHLRSELVSVSAVSKKSLTQAQNWLDKQGTAARETVIFAPYAQTSTCLTQEDCQSLLTYCQKQNWNLFTNCSPVELPLEGTEKMVLPLDVCCGLAQLGCRIVGTQSGFVDTVRWVQDPQLSLLVVMQSHMLCEQDWAEMWHLKDKRNKIDGATYLYQSPEADWDLGQEILETFLHLFEEEI